MKRNLFFYCISIFLLVAISICSTAISLKSNSHKAAKSKIKNQSKGQSSKLNLRHQESNKISTHKNKQGFFKDLVKKENKTGGHYEKVIKTSTQYFWVNGNAPSGLPGAYVVSEHEAKGNSNLIEEQ